MNEAVFMQRNGGLVILPDQLALLDDLTGARAGWIGLRMQAFNETPVGLGGTSTMHLFDFEGPHLPAVAWQEAVPTVGVAEDCEEVDSLAVTYNQAFEESSLTREAPLDTQSRLRCRWVVQEQLQQTELCMRRGSARQKPGPDSRQQVPGGQTMKLPDRRSYHLLQIAANISAVLILLITVFLLVRGPL